MKIIRSIKAASKLSSEIKSRGKTIGFVPTMGYLHEGHISLIRSARRKADVVFVSIFVNPAQFGPKEDFSVYPRDLGRDKKLCEKEKTDYLFCPFSEEIYPKGYSTYVETGEISNFLEGKFRPGHFRGVATIVLKLFNIILPDFAVFGQKDAQQVAVIKKMVKDLNCRTRIITSDTIREKDGLAMSSRNVYLTPKQRKDAPVLFRALKYAERKILNRTYNRDIDFLRSQMKKLIKSRETVTGIDYISFNDAESLEEIKSLKSFSGKMLISLAVRFSKVRLIDNIVVDLKKIKNQ